jgi:hypothetical protein
MLYGECFHCGVGNLKKILAKESVVDGQLVKWT